MYSQQSNTATCLKKLAAAIFGLNALDMSPSTSSIIWSAGLRINMAKELIQRWRSRSFTGINDRQKVLLKVNGGPRCVFNTKLIPFFINVCLLFFSYLLLLSVGQTQPSRWLKEILGYGLWQRLWKSFMGSAISLLVQLPQRQCL